MLHAQRLEYVHSFKVIYHVAALNMEYSNTLFILVARYECIKALISCLGKLRSELAALAYEIVM
jgi:hypothetical protein